MEIGYNSYSYNNVDFYSRANTEQRTVSKEQGVEEDARGVEKSDSSNKSENEKKQSREDPTQLTQGEKVELSELKAIDAQVRAHEAAHQSGPAASGGASFSYKKGPDGIMYAVAGEVPVRIETGSTPQETITNLQGVIATALAPADPSPQDLSVASQARMLLVKAQQEFAKETQEQMQGSEGYVNNALKKYEENSDSQSENIDAQSLAS